MVKKMKNVQLEKMENMGGEIRAGEGAFSPTPDELVQKLVAALKEELELIKNSDRAIESLEFASRLEKTVEKMLNTHGVKDTIVEYHFDEYPITRTYVRIVGDLSWERVRAADVLRAGTTEITIYYEADVLQFRSKYYIKLIEFEVREND
jgi:hypothetical protein